MEKTNFSITTEIMGSQASYQSGNELDTRNEDVNARSESDDRSSYAAEEHRAAASESNEFTSEASIDEQSELPYGGNMDMAMRNQDRDAIKKIMEARKAPPPELHDKKNFDSRTGSKRGSRKKKALSEQIQQIGGDRNLDYKDIPEGLSIDEMMRNIYVEQCSGRRYKCYSSLMEIFTLVEDKIRTGLCEIGHNGGARFIVFNCGKNCPNGYICEKKVHLYVDDDHKSFPTYKIKNRDGKVIGQIMKIIKTIKNKEYLSEFADYLQKKLDGLRERVFDQISQKDPKYGCRCPKCNKFSFLNGFEHVLIPNHRNTRITKRRQTRQFASCSFGCLSSNTKTVYEVNPETGEVIHDSINEVPYSFKWCITCNQEIFFGEENKHICDPELIFSKMDEDTKKFLLENKDDPLKRCKCGHQFSKDKACDHIKCPGCRLDLCFNCMEPWTGYEHLIGSWIYDRNQRTGKREVLMCIPTVINSAFNTEDENHALHLKTIITGVCDENPNVLKYIEKKIQGEDFFRIPERIYGNLPKNIKQLVDQKKDTAASLPPGHEGGDVDNQIGEENQNHFPPGIVNPVNYREWMRQQAREDPPLPPGHGGGGNNRHVRNEPPNVGQLQERRDLLLAMRIQEEIWREPMPDNRAADADA
jgi:hypothetical protein